MTLANPYARTFLGGAVWFGLVVRSLSREQDQAEGLAVVRTIVFVTAWLVTAMLLGVAATRWESVRSWWGIGLGTIFGSLVVTFAMLVILERVYGVKGPPKFKTTNEMMIYLAGESAKWIKQDRGIDMNYSLESIQQVEKELGRISNDVNKTNPAPGTFGIALGYGAYIGEVFRRDYGGEWAVDHPTGGPKSYPLTTRSNTVIFPVGWCWKRLINGDEDNVYHKAMMFADPETAKAVAEAPVKAR